MLERIPFLKEAAEIVLSHQECYDGSGYPRGLQGEQIPLGARIFAVADTLDAMISDRPYRKALPISAAREEIQRYSGRQFDPQVVEVFLSHPDSVWLDTARQRSGIHSASRKWNPPEHSPLAAYILPAASSTSPQILRNATRR